MRKKKKYILGILLLLSCFWTSNMGDTLYRMGKEKNIGREIGYCVFLDSLSAKGNYIKEWKWKASEKKNSSKENLEKLAIKENRKEKQSANFIQYEEGQLEQREEWSVLQNQEEKKNTLVENLEKGKDLDFLLDNFYIIDSSTSIDRDLFQVDHLLEKDFYLKQEDKPQILIYHTHGGSEYFVEGEKEEYSIVEVGEELARELEKLGYETMHDKTRYDVINGKLDRNKAYMKSLSGVEQQLRKKPSLQILIDLHRDGGNTKERKVTEINGEQVAQFMIFNGLSRNKNGDITYLKNPYLQDNLAFGLRLKMAALNKYPNLTVKNYLKAYRYNLHLRKRSLLIELGNQNNSIEEAKNTMKYLAELIYDVIGDEKP